MKQGLLLLCLMFSFLSFGQLSQMSINESDAFKTNSYCVVQNSLVIEQISNKQELKVKRINRPKVSEKKQITTKKYEKSKN